MDYRLSAACGCSVGRIRSNNEDNLYFNGFVLSESNHGLGAAIAAKSRSNESPCFCVFDGMGGEEYGELASFAAASSLKAQRKAFHESVPISGQFLGELCSAMNDAVCERSRELMSRRMGTTMALLLFSSDKVHVCNIGDSRIYLLRDGEIRQLSEDHVEVLPPGSRQRKPGLTQHLGIFRDELLLEPYIAEYGLQKNDVFLICSDGLTDMLSEREICDCVKRHISPRKMVDHLIRQANRNGGRDNTTAIIIKVLK